MLSLGLPCAVASPSPADAVGHLTLLGLLGCTKDGASWSLSISIWWSQSRAVKAWRRGNFPSLAMHKFLLAGFPVQNSADVPGSTGEVVGAKSKAWLW